MGIPTINLHQTTTPRSTLHPTVPRFLPADGQGKRTLTTRQRPHNSRAGSDKTKRHDKTEVISGGKNHQQQSPTGRQHQSKPSRHTVKFAGPGYRASTATCANTTPNTTRRYRYVTGAVPHLQSLPGPDTAPLRRSGRQQLPHTPPPQNISDTDAGFAAAHGTDTLRRLRAMWAWRRTYRRHSDSGLGRRATANEKGKKSSPSSCKSGPSASPHPGNIAL